MMHGESSVHHNDSSDDRLTNAIFRTIGDTALKDIRWQHRESGF
jgi:hypothetical protein